MFRISCSAMTFCRGQPQAPVTFLGMANTPGKRWSWQAHTRGKEQNRYWQGGGVSQSDPLAPSHGRIKRQRGQNKWQRGPQAASLQASGMQATISTLVVSSSPENLGSSGSAVASGATKSDMQPPRQVGLQVSSLQTPTLRQLKLTLLEASMNFTPLYVMDSIMVGIFFICSVDFFRNKNIQVTSCEEMLPSSPPPQPTPETPKPLPHKGRL